MNFDKLKNVPPRAVMLTEYLLQLKKEGKIDKEMDILKLSIFIAEDMKYVGDVLTFINDKE